MQFKDDQTMQFKDDNIYKVAQDNSPFKFNKQVASVFPDMIGRSVPGYQSVINMIEQLAGRYVKEKTNCYDLGCSLGEASLAMDRGIANADTANSDISSVDRSSSEVSSPEITIVSVDNSTAMLDRCQLHLDCYKHHSSIWLKCEDILTTKIENASMVVLNYTLQFIPIEKRKFLINTIFEGLNDGAILIISEKISFLDQQVNQLFIELHHQFKKDNGYSDLEISQKRNALENVLIPETLESHIYRMVNAGFKHVNCWQQHLNFASFIAIK